MGGGGGMSDRKSNEQDLNEIRKGKSKSKRSCVSV